MATPEKRLISNLFLPELKFVKQVDKKNSSTKILLTEKESQFEVCPKYANKSHTIYDHVTFTIRDTPIRSKNIILKIRKRRLYCKNCKSIFREPVQGVFKGFEPHNATDIM